MKDQAELNASLFRDLDRHVKYYQDSVAKNIKYTALFKCRNEIKFRPMDSPPTHYDTCSTVYKFEYLFPGDPSDIKAVEKCIGLTQISNDACATIARIYMEAQTVPWNALYFKITRNEDATVFKGILCLYSQTTEDLIDETIDNLHALKGESPRAIEDYLKKAIRCFWEDVEPSKYKNAITDSSVVICPKASYPF